MVKKTKTQRIEYGPYRVQQPRFVRRYYGTQGQSKVVLAKRSDASKKVYRTAMTKSGQRLSDVLRANQYGGPKKAKKTKKVKFG